MTEENKIALRNSIARKKVSDLTPKERAFYDAEFKYRFSSSDNSPSTEPKSAKTPEVSNLPSTMDFLAARA